MKVLVKLRNIVLPPPPSTIFVFLCVCVGLTMCATRNYVSLHLIGVGTAPEIHSIKFQDHTLKVTELYISV